MLTDIVIDVQNIQSHRAIKKYEYEKAIATKIVSGSSKTHTFMMHFLKVCIPLDVSPLGWMRLNEFDVTHYFWVDDSATQSSR